MTAVTDGLPAGTSSRRIPRWAVALTVIAALGMSLLTGISSPSAHAATHGNYLNMNGFIAGNYLSSDGRSYVYCIEPGADEPYGAQQSPRRMSTIPAYKGDLGNSSTSWDGTVWDTPVSGQTLREMNYVMWTHGRTNVAEQAATVQFAVWLLRRGPGTSPWLDHHIDWVTSHGYGWLIDDANALVAEARAHARSAPSADPDPLRLENLRYEAHASGAAIAEGTVTYPAHTTQLRIDGGEFTDAGAVVPITGDDPGAADWRATLHPDGWQRHHTVEITADWQRDVVAWPDEVMVHPPANGAEQYLGAGISPLTETQRLTLDPVSTTVDTQFAPRLTTQVPEAFVPHGGRFADRVTVDVADDANPWATRDRPHGGVEFAPVVAEGVLYGPFAHPPSESDTVPDRAPIAAEATLHIDEGPGSYDVVADTVADEAGYYSWVWSIRESAQHDEIRSAELLPSEYVYSDRFGTQSEGQVVPSRVRWSTNLVDHELTLDDMRLVDRVTPSLHDGAWLRNDEGTRIPATLRLTVYQTNTKPTPQREAPDDASVIATGTVTLEKPGETVESEAIPIPWETRGWVSVQACLVAEDQPEEARGHLEEWCDDFGVASETAEIVLPHVRTQAQPGAVLGETIRDTAIVTGPVPRDSSLGFTFYLQPEPGHPKFDENWERVRGDDGRVVRWTSEELGELSADERCQAQPVAHTERIDIDAPGEADSPTVVTRSVGTGYWVEDLATLHPETGELVELHRGACGLANERTVITSADAAPSPKDPAAGPALAVTGGAAQAAIALAILFAVGGSALLGVRLRRRMVNDERRKVGQ